MVWGSPPNQRPAPAPSPQACLSFAPRLTGLPVGGVRGVDGRPGADPHPRPQQASVLSTGGFRPCLRHLPAWRGPLHGVSGKGLSWGVSTISLSPLNTQKRRAVWRFSWEAMAVPWGLRWQRLHLQYGTPGFDPWVRKTPWRRAWQPTPVFMPGVSHGQRSLAGCSPRGRKESDTAERLST